MTKSNTRDAVAGYFSGMVVSFRSSMTGAGRAALLAAVVGAGAPVAAPSPVEAAQTRGVARPADPAAAAAARSRRPETTPRFLDEVLQEEPRLAVPKATPEVEPLIAALNPTFLEARDNLLTIARRGEAAGLEPEFLVALNMAAAEMEAALPAGRREKLAGPYKLSESDWAKALAEHGAAAGFARYGTVDAAGRFRPDPQYADALREARSDTAISSTLMAAKANADAMRFVRVVGRPPGAGEALLNHFLGVDATVKLVRAADGNSRISAAKLVPEAAKAQPGLFAGGLVHLTAEQVLNVAESVMLSGATAARDGLRRFMADASESMDSHVPSPRFG